MNLFDKIKALFSPKDSLDLSDWRNWLADAMFYCGAAAMPVAMLFSLPLFWTEKQYGLIAVDIAVCLALILRLVIRSGSYKLWGTCWLLFLYLMTIAFHVQLGPHYTRSAWLVMNTVMAALFFGSKGAVMTSLFNPLILMGCYMLTGMENRVWLQVHGEPFLKYLSFVVNTSLIAGVTSLLVGILLDRLEISYQKQLAINDRLNQSEKRYRLIAENVADVIWKTDMDLNFQYISPSIIQMQGWTPEEGMKNSVADLLVPESLEKVMGLYQHKKHLIESGSDQAWEPIVFEAEQYTKSGSTIWTSIHARVLPETKIESMHILGITRDITASKRTRELIVQSEKMLSIGGLAAGMAHEINNPLAGMMQNAEVLGRRMLDDTLPANLRAAAEVSLDLSVLQAYLEKREIPRMLDTIQQTGARISEIIQSMLRFSRKPDVRQARYSITDLLDQAIELARTDFSLKKDFDFKAIRIIKEYQDNLPLLPCEATAIQQVFLNLLSNGAHAMHSVGTQAPEFSLRVWLEEPGKLVCIQISDNGPGISAENQKRIFDPFFTTKSVDDGTGLGLSISYFLITENHHGTIQVSSQVGKGTQFTIKLPTEQPLIHD